MCQLYLKQVCYLAHCKICWLSLPNLSTSKKHRLPKQVLTRILLIELTTIINVTNPQGFFCQSKADVKWKQQLDPSKLYIVCQVFYYLFSTSIPVTSCHGRKAIKKRNIKGLTKPLSRLWASPLYALLKTKERLLAFYQLKCQHVCLLLWCLPS